MRFPIFLVFLAAVQLPAADAALQTRLRAVAEAYRGGDAKAALELAAAVIKEFPQSPDPWFLRGQLHADLRQHAQAVTDYDAALKLKPEFPAALQERGSAHFRLARMKEAIRDWDEFLRLVPSREPHHWQRGIAYYYAGEFEKGRRQFAIHQTVNSADVENAVFHYICTARALGVGQAAKEFIEIRGDRRVPMMEIHGLFAGKLKPEDVLKAAGTGNPANRAHQLFYAHYYLGLYHEAHGNAAKAREHILLAAKDADANGYMGDCARVHAMLLKAKK